ncbi:hypothetical protein J2790_004275 [Paenarthrobacter nicotinovorans]|uniref:DUF4365 domain-containing protein n=1 Tax=Micrococcaceae TaxID=1268 RepID=UPI001586FDAF|nr:MULTISPECIES: DUF4365 domain-containing protein [Micrococcaceae]MDR6439100.1 hypothetical protein [Paenarthrobacter nicotinovorans]
MVFLGAHHSATLVLYFGHAIGLGGTLTLVLPEGSLHIDQMKEQLSLAVVSMVVTGAGMSTLSWSTDMDGIDTSVRSHVDYPNVYGPTLDIQLKCTSSGWRDKGTHIEYQISRRLYEKMCNPKRHSPAVFCVTMVPEDATSWLNHDVEGLLARAHSYWQAARDFPPLGEGRESVTLKVPKANEFTPAQLLSMIVDLHDAESA